MLLGLTHSDKILAFYVIPAEAGIQQIILIFILDSGSPPAGRAGSPE
ncbi:MAG: hypothetical protein NT136_03840 [Candidatus Moranbacteria bacterium]|nr:hypothetical protein [Candidatus Moranbacteria bacterium]